MPAGRPRLVAPTPEQCIEIGERLKKWITYPINQRFQQFYTSNGILRKDWKNLIQMPEFLPYYEEAQAALAQKCIDGTMEKSFGHRFIRLYERDLVEEENDTAKFTAEIKKPAEVAAITNTILEYSKFIEDKKHSAKAADTV